MTNKPLTEEDKYPLDIWPPMTEEQCREIHNWMMCHMDIPLDRLSAHIARKMLAVRLDEEKSAKRLLKQELKRRIDYDYRVLERVVDACFQIPDGDEKDVD